MAKGKLLEDTFEQLVELGSSTTKKTVKAVAQTLNPFDGEKNDRQNQLNSQAEKLKNKKNNHTPLGLRKIKRKIPGQRKSQNRGFEEPPFPNGQTRRRATPHGAEAKRVDKKKKGRVGEVGTETPRRRKKEKGSPTDSNRKNP
ncbi:hypothetical protein M1328_03170 [Patescibacteria group bacterium]|nr:hypothetical protein [Patescibacteria group bacterium]